MFAINKRCELLSNALHIWVAVLSLPHFNSNDFIQTIETNRIFCMYTDANMLLSCPPSAFSSFAANDNNPIWRKCLKGNSTDWSSTYLKRNTIICHAFLLNPFCFFFNSNLLAIQRSFVASLQHHSMVLLSSSWCCIYSACTWFLSIMH